MSDIGKIHSEPAATYHATDAVSSHRLRLFAQHQARYRDRYVTKVAPDVRTATLDFGTALHSLMEGDEAFRAATVVNTQFKDFRTDAAKAWRDGNVAAGKVVLSKSDLLALSTMRANIVAHPTAGPLVAAATEAEVTWRARVGNFVIQCRTDRWSEAGCDLVPGAMYLDFKTTPSLLDDAFVREAASYDYAFQNVFYKEVIATVKGLGRDDVRPRGIIVAVESEPPHEVQVFEPDTESSMVARAEIMQAVRDLRIAYSTGVWRGLPTGITPLEMPGWKIRETGKMLLAAKLAIEE